MNTYIIKFTHSSLILKFVIAEGGSQEKSLKDLAKSHGIPDSIVFCL